MRWLACSLVAVLAACPEAPVRPPPPPPSVAPAPLLPHVPPGCEANLAGLYAHRDDATFRYQVEDDGLTLHAHAFRQYGGTRVELPAGADIAWRRTATGIHGEAHATARNRLQKACAVDFPYELTGCTDVALTLRTAPQLSLGDDCALLDVIHLNLVENVLVRVSPPAGGAVAPDAGLVSMDAGNVPAAEAAGPLDAG